MGLLTGISLPVLAARRAAGLQRTVGEACSLSQLWLGRVVGGETLPEPSCELFPDFTGGRGFCESVCFQTGPGPRPGEMPPE